LTCAQERVYRRQRSTASRCQPSVIAVAGNEIAVGIVVLTIVVDVVLVRRLLDETLPVVAAPRSGST
jgi:hypothetical protein